MDKKTCIFDENKECDNCGDCRCDLNPDKICDNCEKCLNTDNREYAEIFIDKVITDDKNIRF